MWGMMISGGTGQGWPTSANMVGRKAKQKTQKSEILVSNRAHEQYVPTTDYSGRYGVPI